MISESNHLLTWLEQTQVRARWPHAVMYRYSRLIMAGIMVISDLIALLIAFFIPLLIWVNIDPLLLPKYLDILPGVIVFFLTLFLAAGLYPALGLRSYLVLKKLVLAITLGFLLLGTATFYLRNALEWSRGSFAVSYVLSIFIIPNMRILARMIAAKLGLWGEPVAIIGYDKIGKRIYRQLAENSQLGFQPVVAYSGLAPENTQILIDKPDPNDKSNNIHQVDRIQTAILVTDEISPEVSNLIFDQNLLRFPRRILVNQGMQHFGSGLMYQLGAIFGSEETNDHKSRWRPYVKRLIDLVLTLLTAPIWLLVGGLIALAIRIDTPGPIFFCQNRIGKGGKQFRIFKFRSMVANADQMLEPYLKDNPDEEREWLEFFKLKHDPRITAVGRFLRRTSLDELPQVLNILEGNMSIVGPRPILIQEIAKFGDRNQYYCMVRPGLTGLWQISGRNNLTLRDRYTLDDHYVKNWTLWLDIDILLQTPWVMLSGEGAY